MLHPEASGLRWRGAERLPVLAGRDDAAKQDGSQDHQRDSLPRPHSRSFPGAISVGYAYVGPPAG